MIRRQTNIISSQEGSKRPWSRWIFFGFWIVILVTGVTYVVRHADFSIVADLPWDFWGLQVFILLSYLLFAAVLNLIILRRMGVGCSLLEVFLILQASYSASYLGPLKLGVPVRILLFRETLSTSYSKGTSATIAAQGIRLVSLAFVAAVGIGVKFRSYYIHLLVVLGALGIVALMGLLILRLSRLVHVQQRLLERVQSFLVSIYDAMRQIGVGTAIGLGVLSVGLMMLLSFSSFLIIDRFGGQVAYSEILFIDAISVFVGFVSFIPMGLGTRDATSILLLSQAKALQDSALYSVVIVQRMIWSLLPLIVGVVSFGILWIRVLICRDRRCSTPED